MQSTKKILACLLSAIMVIGCIPFCAAAQDGGLKIATISDIHYFDISEDTVIDDGFINKANASTEQIVQAEGILDSALAAAEADGVSYVLISGDLSFNGEKRAHEALAAKLAAFEEKTGISVIVGNGNHDINNSKASKYVYYEDIDEGVWERDDTVTAWEFHDIYQNLGFDLAYHTYNPVVGQAGGLSYSVQLDGGYRLIVMDCGRYSSDGTESGRNEHETGGNMTPELLEWVLAEIEDAKSCGETPIGMTHWNLAPMNFFQGYVMQGFVMDNWEELSATLANAGMHFVFTGHSHAPDISSSLSDDGERLYTIETASLSAFPNQFRETTFSKDGDNISATFENIDCDKVLPVTDCNGKTYSQPYRTSKSFGTFFGGGDAVSLVMGLIDAPIREVLDDVADAGLITYLEYALGMDFGVFFDELLHGGLVIRNQNILTSANIMAFLEDIAAQIERRFIDDPDYTMSLVETLVSVLCDLQISDYPCDRWLDEYGFGSTTEPGTFSQAVMSAMLYMYTGNEDASEDKFMQDALAKIESGEFIKTLIGALKDYVIKDFLCTEVLGNIDINLSSLILADSASGFKATLLELEESLMNGGDENFDIIGKLKEARDAAMDAKGLNIDVMKERLDGVIYSLDDILAYLGAPTIGMYYEILAGIIIDPATLITLLSTVTELVDLGDIDLTVDTSILSYANLILGLGLFKDYGTSVDEVIDFLIDTKVATDDQAGGIGYQAALILGSLVKDEDPQFKGDYDVTYTYSGPETVIPTKEDYRLPSMIATTFGSDAGTEYNISWYSKKTLDTTDIEIYKTDEAPVFTGEPTTESKDFTIETDAYELTRYFYGVDFGVFGLLPYEMTMMRHTVKLSGLEPGATYYYRIGNAARGWWSEVGTIKTADGSDTFSFIHVTDTQSQSQAQYDGAFGKVLESAFYYYPETAFILHTGDFCDYGDNVHQWTWCLNTAEPYSMKTAIQPAAGNHEGFGKYAITDNFLVEAADENYDTETGVFYSFDYNNAHIAVLNTNDLCEDGTLTSRQLNWLKEDMNASEATWKFVAFHKAVYSNGDHYKDDDIIGLRGQIAKLMPELDVDMVFMGHDHVYFRTDALNNNQIFPYEKDVISFNGLVADAMVNPDGTVYSINGTAGVKKYNTVDESLTAEYFPSPVTTYSVVNPMYSSITINGDQLIFKSYTVDSEGNTREIDSFGIEKTVGYVLVGDTNLDGKIRANDAREALRAAAQLERILGRSRCAADIDGDGFVEASDARMILRAAAGLETFDPKMKPYDTELYGVEQPDNEHTHIETKK